MIASTQNHHHQASRPSRIPAAMRSVFLASNRGMVSKIAPPEINPRTGAKAKAAAVKAKEGVQVDPQSYLDKMMESRGYSTERFQTLKTAYHNKPTPLQLASHDVHLTSLVLSKDVKALRDIMSCGVSANPCNVHGESLIHAICRRGDHDILCVMIESGTNLQVADDYGRTPLHDACWAAKPCFDVVESILRVDRRLLNMADARGSLPLSYVPRDHWGAWIEWLKTKEDVFWPARKLSKDGEESRPPLTTLPPNTRPTNDPIGALPPDLAKMVVSGRISPDEARMLHDTDGTTANESESDFDEVEFDDDDDWDSDSEDEYSEAEEDDFWGFGETISNMWGFTPGFLQDKLKSLQQNFQQTIATIPTTFPISPVKESKPRIPATLQSVILASNRGGEVNKPPPERVACKVFTPATQLSSIGTSNEATKARQEKQSKAATPTPKKVQPSNAKSLSPQDHLETLLESRGYSTTRFPTLRSAYYNQPTSLQMASYDLHLIQLARASDEKALNDVMSCGISANPCNKQGESLLHMVCRRGNHKLLKVMLDHGAELQVSDDYGRTPLHDACWAAEPCFDVVETILDIDRRLLNMEDARGYLPLSYVHPHDWGSWMKWIEEKMDKYFPRRNKAVDGEEKPPPKTEMPPNSCPIKDPKDATTLELARMLVSGRMKPSEARLMMMEESARSDEDCDDEECPDRDSSDDEDDEFSESDDDSEAGSGCSDDDYSSYCSDESSFSEDEELLNSLGLNCPRD